MLNKNLKIENIFPQKETELQWNNRGWLRLMFFISNVADHVTLQCDYLTLATLFGVIAFTQTKARMLAVSWNVCPYFSKYQLSTAKQLLEVSPVI